MASHELRNPLVTIRGNAQLMRRRETYSARSVDAIIAQADRLDRLVGDLLLTTQIGADRLDLRPTVANLTDEARAAVEALPPEGPPVHIEGPAEALPVLVDRQRLGQVFANLLTNAVKYSPGGGAITCTMRNCHPASLTGIGPTAILLAALRVMGGGAMVWSALASLVAVILDLLTARPQSEGAKDLEIVVLRHQLRMLERRQPRLRLSRWERLTLALLVAKLQRLTAGGCQRWSRSLVLVVPETVLRWHRDLVRRKWTVRGCRRAGRRPRRVSITSERASYRVHRPGRRRANSTPGPGTGRSAARSADRSGLGTQPPLARRADPRGQDSH